MLSLADQGLVARDRLIPGLAMVLDDEQLAERVGPALGEPSLQLRATYVRYKPATSCIVGYEAGTASGHQMAYAGAFARPSRPKAAKLARQRGVALPDHVVALRLGPDDLELPALGRLFDGEREALLERLLPSSPELWSAVPTLLRYKPERRAVIRADVAGRAAFVVKCHAEDAAFTRADHAAYVLRRASAARIPAVLGRSRRHRTLVYAWTPGRNADADPSDAETVAAVAASLATLHRSRTGRLRRHGPADVVAELDASVRALGALDPALGARAGQLAATIAARWDRTAVTGEVFLHGDVSLDQFIVDACGVTVLDTDRAAAGDAHRDVGQLLATLPTSSRDVAIDSYRMAGGHLDARTLTAATAAALLHRAVEPFRRRQSGWRASAAALLGAAAEQIT